MQIKFTSNLGQLPEVVFLIISNKNALKRIGLQDNLLSEAIKAIENKGFGFKKDDLEMNFSYDINVSDLIPATNNKGGFELSIIYSWEKSHKKKNSNKNPQSECPKYL